MLTDFFCSSFNLISFDIYVCLIFFLTTSIFVGISVCRLTEVLKEWEGIIKLLPLLFLFLKSLLFILAPLKAAPSLHTTQMLLILLIPLLPPPPLPPLPPPL